jgi:uncharacterized protein (TIGR02600 family)
MFGSLPTGIQHDSPWQTLLFRPPAEHPDHPGAASPPDYLMLDLFWMPVVQPYAISENFATSGKINLNYQIQPFTYIRRATALYALLKSEMVGAIPNTDVGTSTGTLSYKQDQNQNHTYITPNNYRLPIDPAQTLSECDTKFNAGGLFKSAAEICSVDMVPVGQTASGMSTFWNSYQLTGDNLREKVYTNLYGRLTTKSNTYTVYFRAQSLKKAPRSTYGVWTEGTDVITSEYRGSTQIERFINPNNTSIPDYAKDAASGTIANDATLDTFYKWRVIENHQFAP